jgi:hypothetical protein
MNFPKYIIKDATLPNGDQRDITIENGLIVALSQTGSATPTSTDHVVIQAKELQSFAWLS